MVWFPRSEGERQHDAEWEEEPSFGRGVSVRGFPGGAEGPDPLRGRKQACLLFKALKTYFVNVQVRDAA